MIFTSIINSIALMVSIANGANHAQPANHPGTWVTASDYPPSALILGSHGTTGFQLKIGVDGMVKSCVIIKSSGSAILDQTACQKVKQRARFHPATDENGKPTEGSWTNRVRWALPGTQLTFSLPHKNTASHELTLIVEKDGSVSSCTFDRAMSEDQKAMLCEKAQAQFSGLLNSNIIKERTKIVVTTTTKLEIELAGDDE